VLTLLVDYLALCSLCNSRESVNYTVAIKVHTASQTPTQLSDSALCARVVNILPNESFESDRFNQSEAG
ncbi:hypothetical protein, partial [Acinetobacter baumannii]|uniref:hypothetical protein n=1 Tax=Acinetobacter baumannii TaxID=470 RepID=UPI003394886E